MTHDERVYHHLYVDSKSPLENAERIAELEELVLDYYDAPCFCLPSWTEDECRTCRHCDCGNCDLAVRTLELVEVDDERD